MSIRKNNNHVNFLQKRGYCSFDSKIFRGDRKKGLIVKPVGASMTEYYLTVYCGLYGVDCLRFQSRVSELAGDLLKEFENTRLGEYAKVKAHQISNFQHYEMTVKLLPHISLLRCKIPCRLGGNVCGGSCPVMECVKVKSTAGCWEMAYK